MPIRHVVLVLLICLAWGGNFLFSALALREIPPFLFTALRLGLLVPLLAFWLRRPLPGQGWRLLGIGLCTGVLHFGLSFWALKLAGNLASPAILMQSYVPMATLLAVLFLGERIGWKTVAGIAASFAGVLVLGFDPVVLESPASMGLMLVSALFLAMGTVMMRGLTGLTPMGQQCWVAIIAIMPLLALSLVLEHDQWHALRAASWTAWGGVVYSSLIASVLGHGLFYWLVQRHPVSTVTPYLLLAPVVAIVLGILFFGDRPGLRLLLGGAMVLGGVLTIAVRAKARATEAPPLEL